ncbi:hypothetical protein C0J52_21258 [Blattella germanica]|nr:hypothetical protein C0J52_21258 [Blattella germanica]
MKMDDDWDDDFVPLSMSGLSTKKEKNEISLSQTSSITRLSRSFRKRNVKNRKPYAESNATSSVSMPISTSNSHQSKPSDEIRFCPSCQAPFDIMKIDPMAHAAQCVGNWNELPECPQEEYCYNDKLIHYQHYSHGNLARIRASKGHLSSGSPTKSTTIRENINFKAPRCSSDLKASKSLCKPVGANSLHPKRKLFTESESTISITSSSTDACTAIISPIKKAETLVSSTTNKRECINRKPIAKPSCSSTPKRNRKERVLKKNKSNDNTVCESEKSSASSIMDTKIKQSNLVSFFNSPSKGIESDNDSDFKTPPLKRRNKQELDKSGHKKHEIQNYSLLNSGKNTGESVKERNITILDTLDSDMNESNLKKKQLVEVGCKCNERPNLGSVDRCGENEDNPVHSSQEPNEVRATMSIIVSPTVKQLEDCLDETPVKVDASCDKLGWRTVGIAAPSTTEVGNVSVNVCKCTKTMEVNCFLSKNEAETSPEKNMDPNTELEMKFFSHVSDYEITKHVKTIKPEAANHQMSITSFFRASKEPSTLSLKTSIGSTEAGMKSSCSSGFQCLNDSLITNNVERKTSMSSSSKQDKEATVASWKKIMKGMVQKGQSTLSVMSDDSIASTNTQTSVNSQNQYRVSKKNCPFYKKIPDTSFVVDAFQYGYIPGISHYFLSHFHYDHYGGLTRSFAKPIYCSNITAALVKLKLRVDQRYINVLEQDTPRKIGGVLVTALDANQYCEPKYDFPLQSEIITRVTELAMEHDARYPRTLFVCGAYTIGKEKVFVSIAEALNCKIWAHPDKRKILDCINNPVINEKLTSKQLDAQVHVCRMFDLNCTFLQKYLKQHSGKFSHLVAFAPTGWEIKGKNDQNSDGINVTAYGNITMYGVPYSEHSSFTELKRFVQFLKPVEIIPTVNAEVLRKRNAMQKHFHQWLSEPRTVNHENKHTQQKMNNYFHSYKKT